MIVVIITQFLVLSLSRIVICKPFQSEPMCSRYYHEEKLLTKTIKLEYAVEELVKNKNEMEAKFTEELEKMAGKFKQLDAVVMKMDNKTEARKSVQATTCPSPYMYEKGANLCWRLQKDVKLNWFDASKECSKQGAHLMILNSTTSVKIMQNYLAAADASDVFVGAHDMIEEGTFKWTNGETVQQLPWYRGEPNGADGHNCLAIHKALNYKFSDYLCSAKFQLLCQITL